MDNRGVVVRDAEIVETTTLGATVYKKEVTGIIINEWFPWNSRSGLKIIERIK